MEQDESLDNEFFNQIIDFEDDVDEESDDVEEQSDDVEEQRKVAKRKSNTTSCR